MNLASGDRVRPLRTVDGWMTPDMVGTVLAAVPRPGGRRVGGRWFRVAWDGDDIGYVEAGDLERIEP